MSPFRLYLPLILLGTLSACAGQKPPTFETPRISTYFSEPANGLVARLEPPQVDLAYAGGIFVRIKNNSAKLLVIPISTAYNSDSPFSLIFKFQESFCVPLDSHPLGKGQLDTDPPVIPPPTATLQPQQDVVVFIPIDPYSIGFRQFLHPDVSWDDAAASYQIHYAVKGGSAGVWTGSLSTPIQPLRLNLDMIAASQDTQTLPTIFPAFRRPKNPNSMSPLKLNEDLLRQLLCYVPSQVAAEMDRRLATADNPMDKLLPAIAATRAGSSAPQAFFRDLSAATSLEMVQNRLDGLAFLAWCNAPQAWVMDDLIASLNDNRPVVDPPFGTTVSEIAARHSAIPKLLAEWHCSRAVPALLALGQSPGRAADVLEPLGNLGDPAAIPFLIETLQKNQGRLLPEGRLYPYEYEAAVDALGKLHATQAVPLLIDHPMTSPIIRALARIGDPRAIPALQRTVAEKSGLAPEALTALAILTRKDPIPALCDRASQPDPDTVLDAIAWLKERPDPRAVPTLLLLVRTNQHGNVKEAAIAALASFPYDATVTGLIDCFSVEFDHTIPNQKGEPRTIFGNAISRTLSQLTRQNLPPDKSIWEAWWNSRDRSLTPPGTDSPNNELHAMN